LEGFWIHRLLIANGVDAASIAVPRRHRRTKTDSIDGETLPRTLMAWARGERRVCSMVRAPSAEDEDHLEKEPQRGDGRADCSGHRPGPSPSAIDIGEHPRLRHYPAIGKKRRDASDAQPL
jgi:hypothetical protein